MKNNPLKRMLFTCIQSWQDLGLGIKGIIVIALPLAILMASLAALYWREQQATLLQNKLHLALQSRHDIQAVHTQLLEASTGVRDYLLTGQKNFLDIYYDAEQKLPTILQDLELQLEDTAQKERLDQIKPLVLKNLADLKVLAANDLDTASDKLITQFRSQSKTLDKLRAAIEEMIASEAILIDQDQIAVNWERQRNLNTTLIAAISGILGALAGAWLFSNTIVKRVRLLRDCAGHLARGEALALPSSSRDELGQLSEELDHAAQLLSKSTHESHQAREEAEKASAAKSMFLSRTSHELRTPLNAILGFSQLLEADLPQGKHRDNITIIKNSGQHLLKLINEVLDIARIESGELALELAAFTLSPLLDEAVQFIRPLGKIRDIEIQTDYPTDIAVKANRQKLLQVVLNLLSNALKYGPANSPVKISARQVNNMIMIEVLDQGKGIPKTKRERLFTPFDRLGAENTKIEGTGLGLALSRQIMASMQGSIDIADDKGLFWLTLPATTMATPPSHAEEAQQTYKTYNINNKQKILYVEDNASNKALMEAIISRHQNLRLYTVTTIKQTLAFLQEITPDILLVDLHLPDGSGESLIKQLQANAAYTNIPIVVLSADAMPETIARLSDLGITNYFTKPLDISAFNWRLKTLMSHEEHHE